MADLIPVPDHIKRRATECAYVLEQDYDVPAEHQAAIESARCEHQITWEVAKEIFRIYDQIVDRRV